MEWNLEYLNDQGGVFTRPAALRWGNSDADLRRSLASGQIQRIRPGWYQVGGADPQVVASVRAGGSLGCVSALRRRGVWTVDERLHIRAGEDGLRRRPPGTTVCRLPGSRTIPMRGVDDVATALVTASNCCPADQFVVALDSVVNLGLASTDEVADLFVGAPRRVRRLLEKMGRAESGTETLVRLGLLRMGLPVRSQVQIPEVGRVDLLVGDRMVIEVDSIEHHTSRLAYERDRERDRRLRALGYVVIRLTYRQVMHDWPCVAADIADMVARGEHRSTRRHPCLAV